MIFKKLSDRKGFFFFLILGAAWTAASLDQLHSEPDDGQTTQPVATTTSQPTETSQTLFQKSPKAPTNFQPQLSTQIAQQSFYQQARPQSAPAQLYSHQTYQQPMMPMFYGQPQMAMTYGGNYGVYGYAPPQQSFYMQPSYQPSYGGYATSYPRPMTAPPQYYGQQSIMYAPQHSLSQRPMPVSAQSYQQQPPQNYQPPPGTGWGEGGSAVPSPTTNPLTTAAALGAAQPIAGPSTQAIASAQQSMVENLLPIKDSPVELGTINQRLDSLQKRIESEGKYFFKDALKGEAEEFKSIVQLFSGITGAISGSNFGILQSFIKEREATTEMLNRFSSMLVAVLEEGLESTDKDEVSIFSNKDYSSDRTTRDNLVAFSESFSRLIQNPGFVLVTHELGQLEQFVNSCKVLLKPPFIPDTVILHPSTSEPLFKQLYEELAKNLINIADKLHSSKYDIVKNAPEMLLKFLAKIQRGQHSTILRGLGYKEKMAMQQEQVGYDFTLDDIKIAMATGGIQVGLARGAEISRDILRDVMAEGIVYLLIIAADTFISRVSTSTLGNIRQAHLKRYVTAALRNIIAVKTTWIETISLEDGSKTEARRLIILDKVKNRNAEILRQWHTKAVERYGKNSGQSFHGQEIVDQLRKADDLLETGLAEGIMQFLPSADTKYVDGVAILKNILSNMDYMESFKKDKVTKSSPISSTTVQEIFRLIEDAYEDVRNPLNISRGAKYKEAFTSLMEEVMRNGPFRNRVANLDPKLSGKLDAMARKYGVSTVGKKAPILSRMGYSGFSY